MQIRVGALYLIIAPTTRYGNDSCIIDLLIGLAVALPEVIDGSIEVFCVATKSDRGDSVGRAQSQYGAHCAILVGRR